MNDLFKTNFDDLDDNFTTIHVRVVKRSNKKFITIIEGLDTNLNLKKILKFMKTSFSCNGNIDINEEENIKIIKLQGDHRGVIQQFLLNEKITDTKHLIIHGW